MAIIPAPKTLTQKWHKGERQTSSNFFGQKDLSGPEVFKTGSNFEKNRGEHGSFDFFLVYRPLLEKNFVRNFFPKIFSNSIF